MNPNLAKPLIAVIAATVGLGIWQYARASSAPAPQAAQVTQIDGGNMPADHASHHMANAASANIFTGTLPYMGAAMNTPNAGAMMGSTDMSDMMKSGDMSDMMKSGDMSDMMKSGAMSDMMKSGDMSDMMKSGDMSAMMSATDKQDCLDAAGDTDKMQAHMARMSQMPGHVPTDTESAK